MKLKTVKRLNNRVGHQVKMKEMPTKVPQNIERVSRQNRRVFVDQTNQGRQRKLVEKKMPQDEKTKLRRPRWVLADKTNLQAMMDKQSLDKDKEIEGKKNVQVFAQNDESVKKEAEDQKEEMVDEAIEDETKEVEETELEAKQEKVDKWDPLDGLSEYEKIRLENIRQVSTALL